MFSEWSSDSLTIEKNYVRLLESKGMYRPDSSGVRRRRYKNRGRLSRRSPRKEAMQSGAIDQKPLTSGRFGQIDLVWPVRLSRIAREKYWPTA